MKRSTYVAAVLTAVLALAVAAARAQSPPPVAAAKAVAAVDPGAMAALNNMGTYLRTLKAYGVEVWTSTEEVLDNGQKSSLDGVTQLVVQMPDRLRVEVKNDRQDRQYLYNGKEFTLYGARVGYYATVPAPPTLRQLVDRLEEKYGISVPLVDLFLWGAAGSNAADAITVATDLGPSQIEGTTCQHYAFRQDGLDWQAWIQKGDFPLPRKLVLTTTTDEARPQFTAVYTWNLAPSFNDAAFTFDPPSDAQRILLAELPAAGARK